MVGLESQYYITVTYPSDATPPAAADPSANLPCISLISLSVSGEYRPIGELYCPLWHGGDTAAGLEEAGGLTGVAGKVEGAGGSVSFLGTWKRFFLQALLPWRIPLDTGCSISTSSPKRFSFSVNFSLGVKTDREDRQSN